ncbi:MAG: PqqD family protein [Chromatiaceae bacterium]|nr:MAG: PqqD family protein [Chromatiaceae bacterium]
MASALDQVVSIPDVVLFQEVAGQAVLLNLQTERYFGLNEVATRALQLLQQDGHLAAAFETLAREYDVAPERLMQDLLTLVRDLEAAGLVVSER